MGTPSRKYDRYQRDIRSLGLLRLSRQQVVLDFLLTVTATPRLRSNLQRVNLQSPKALCNSPEEKFPKLRRANTVQICSTIAQFGGFCNNRLIYSFKCKMTVVPCVCVCVCWCECVVFDRGIRGVRRGENSSSRWRKRRRWVYFLTALTRSASGGNLLSFFLPADWPHAQIHTYTHHILSQTCCWGGMWARTL